MSALPEPVVKSFLAQPTKLGGETDLLRLECFSEVTGDSLREGDLNCGSTPKFLRDFVAAHYSPRFIEIGRPWVSASRLKRSFERALPAIRFPAFPCTNNRDSWPADFMSSVDSFALRQLVEDRVRFWRGWTATSAAGRLHCFRFWKFRLRYGESRTDELHAAIRVENSLKQAAVNLPVTAFAEWMAAYPIDIDYNDSLQLGRSLSEFFPNFFHAGHESGVRLMTLINQWRGFALLMKRHLLGHAWALPIPAMPMPSSISARAKTLNLVMTANGAVTQGLVTPIPIQVTDAEAKELLFRDIEREVDVVLAWARVEIEQARLRLECRLRLAPTGIVTKCLAPGEWNGQLYRLSPACPERLAHAAATFEAVGFLHLNQGRAAKSFYPRPVAETSWELGIPTPGLLLAHGAVLVAKHPAITPGFLESLNLYDRDGQQIGLQETDSGWYLIGFKRRRGPRLAQQKVLLDKESLDVVRDVIALTQPLRDWLRVEGDDRWRRLFLATANVGRAPRDWQPTKETFNAKRWMASRLSHTLALPPKEASDLAERFSLKRLRSSAAVLVYLRTGSVQRMAEALGHAQWEPRLLDHYLPKPLQEFFTERWLRIFQTQILVEALKESSYILEATCFESMSELDEFLENHALRPIPSHLEDPDGIGAEVLHDSAAKVVVCVELGILTVLLSLEGAVRQARRVPCGRAIRWARIAEKLVPYLEAQTERPEFRAIVAEAKQHANPSRVEHLIYG